MLLLNLACFYLQVQLLTHHETGFRMWFSWCHRVSIQWLKVDKNYRFEIIGCRVEEKHIGAACKLQAAPANTQIATRQWPMLGFGFCPVIELAFAVGFIKWLPCDQPLSFLSIIPSRFWLTCVDCHAVAMAVLWLIASFWLTPDWSFVCGAVVCAHIYMQF